MGGAQKVDTARKLFNTVVMAPRIYISRYAMDWLQWSWEQKLDWDDVVPDPIYKELYEWRSELHLLSTEYIPRCELPSSN